MGKNIRKMPATADNYICLNIEDRIEICSPEEVIE